MMNHRYVLTTPETFASRETFCLLLVIAGDTFTLETLVPVMEHAFVGKLSCPYCHDTTQLRLYEKGDTLIASAGAIQWLVNGQPIPSATSSTYVLRSRVNIHALLIDSGCSIASNTLVISSIDGVIAMDVALYPNPSGGIYHLSVGWLSWVTRLEIFDIEGKPVYRRSITAIESGN